MDERSGKVIISISKSTFSPQQVAFEFDKKRFFAIDVRNEESHEVSHGTDSYVDRADNARKRH